MGELAQEFWDRAWKLQPLATDTPTQDNATDWRKLDGWDTESELTFHRLHFGYGIMDDGSKQLKADLDKMPIYWGHRYIPMEDEVNYLDDSDTVFKPDLFIIALDHLRKTMVLDDLADS